MPVTVGLLATSGCGPTYEPAETHPDDSAEEVTSPASIVVERVLWTAGVLLGDANEEFGNIADVALDPSGRSYLLDAGANVVRIFSRTGEFTGAFGGTGRGPGEFATPVRLILEADTLYVLDRQNGLSLFESTGDPPRYTRRIAFDHPMADFCFMGESVVTYGPAGDGIIHEMTREGRLVRSFGALFGPPGDEEGELRMAQTERGRIACIHEAGVVVAVARGTPEMRGYRFADGELLWSQTAPRFEAAVTRSYAHPGSPTGYAYSSFCVPAVGCSINTVLYPLGGEVALLQHRRVPNPRDPEEIVTSCILRVFDGRCVEVVQSLPLMPAIQAEFAMTVEQLLFPKVSLVVVTKVGR